MKGTADNQNVERFKTIVSEDKQRMEVIVGGRNGRLPCTFLIDLSEAEELLGKVADFIYANTRRQGQPEELGAAVVVSDSDVNAVWAAIYGTLGESRSVDVLLSLAQMLAVEPQRAQSVATAAIGAWEVSRRGNWGES